ncbi:dihydrolipoyl dehydrogenase [Tistrella mobilis]|uniref:dihydrolipoyl dehydrogenase n=1 Tax=Tistrella mobilis TaxID=171437 RepID=UPI003556FA6A
MSDTQSFDVVIIGGGPGGYIAAIRAAQLGLKTACVEKRGALGGTCLNVGCIPSKALLQSSELYAETKHGLEEHGVKLSGVELDLAAMMTRKGKVVSQLTGGIEGLFKKNKVAYFKGTGRFVDATTIEVALNDGGTETIKTRETIIATGSTHVDLPGVEIDEKRIVSSTGALEFEKVPGRLVVIGGGVIGLELGSVWSRLGSAVTVVEFMDRITPEMDGEVSKQFQRILGRQGLKFRLSTKVTGADTSGEVIKLTVEPAKGGDAETIEADAVLVAIGRKPYTEGLGLEAVGIETGPRGRIEVDDHFRTNVPNIRAIGDVIKGPMLAHKAEEEGVIVAEMIAGQSGHIDYNLIPGVIYTWPEVASVGRTEEQLKAEGIAYKPGKFPFSANSRARAVGETDGFVKILADAETDRILGAHIIGPDAGTLISELVLAMEFKASAEDIARTSHAHPTLEEAVKEAALAVDGRTLNM